MSRGVRGLCVVFVFLFALMPLATAASQRAVLQAEGDGESRETPYGVGQTGKVGDYELTVLELTPDATEMVLGENSFNEPPEQGNVFVMARVEATYTGRETGEPGFDLRFNVVGDQNRGYSESQADCGVIPDEAYDAPELFPGGAAEFNVCWSVPEEEVDSLVMYVEAGFSDERVWFSLHDEAPSSVDSQDDGESAEQTEDEQPVDESSDTLTIEAGDLFFEPSDFEVSPGGTITVTNIGMLPHDFAVDEWGGVLIGPLEANESGQDTVPDDAQPGDTFTFYCSIPGHKEAGMTGTLTIIEADERAREDAVAPTEVVAEEDDLGPGVEVTIDAGDLFFEPAEFEVAPGDTIVLNNIGMLPHDMAVDEWGGVIIGPLGADESGEYTVPQDARPGDTFTFYCSIPGHREAGMEGMLTIVEPPTDATLATPVIDATPVSATPTTESASGELPRSDASNAGQATVSPESVLSEPGEDEALQISGTGSTVTEDFELEEGRYQVTVDVASGCCIILFIHGPSGAEELLFSESFPGNSGGAASAIFQVSEPGVYFIESQLSDSDWTVTFEDR